MALIVILAWSMIILGISIVAMVTHESDPTFAGEAGEVSSWESDTLEVRRAA